MINIKLPQIDKKKVILYASVGLVFYIIDAWVIGTLAAFLKGLALGDTTFAKSIWENPLKAAIFMPFSEARNYWLFFNAIILGIIGLGYFIYKTNRQNVPKDLKFIKNPAHATSRWMNDKEVKVNFEQGYGKGAMLGIYKGTPIRLTNPLINRNIIVFGAPGTKKTRSQIIPAGMQAVASGESVIYVDPKGEIAQTMLQYHKDAGYETKVFNLVNMLHSDRWNPLKEIKEDLDAQIFAEIVIANTNAGTKAGGDPFFDRGEKNLIKAIALYVVNEAPDNPTMEAFYEKISGGDMDQLDIVFKSLDADHPAKAPYNIFCQAKDSVRTGMVMGLGTRLQLFQNTIVKKLTEESDIDLEAPGKRKCAYFLIIPDTDSTFEFIASLFLSFLMIKLTRLGDRSGGRMPVSVNFLLDEFCNVGSLGSDFTKRLATMRSRGINITMIVQSLPQLSNRYQQNGWQEIISCCDTRLFLGVNDTMTAKYLTELLGKGAVENVSFTRTEGIKGALELGRVTYSYKARELLTVDEIMRLDNNKAIVMVRGQYPLMVDKLDYSQHPENTRLTPSHISNYRPHWAVDLLPPDPRFKEWEEFEFESSVIKETELITAESIKAVSKEKVELTKEVDIAEKAESTGEVNSAEETGSKIIRHTDAFIEEVIEDGEDITEEELMERINHEYLEENDFWSRR